eukprot:2932288-Alexandrium_andersonii.AAC.1
MARSWRSLAATPSVGALAFGRSACLLRAGAPMRPWQPTARSLGSGRSAPPRFSRATSVRSTWAR